MNPHLKYNDDISTIDEPLEMSNRELDTIIRLIPRASQRQTLIIEGQIEIHKQLTKTKE